MLGLWASTSRRNALQLQLFHVLLPWRCSERKHIWIQTGSPQCSKCWDNPVYAWGTSWANVPFGCHKEHWLRVSSSSFCTSIPRVGLLARDGRHQHPSISLGSTTRGGSWPTAEFHPWHPNNPWLKGSETPLGQSVGSDLINKGQFLLGSSSSFQLLPESH